MRTAVLAALALVVSGCFIAVDDDDLTIRADAAPPDAAGPCEGLSLHDCRTTPGCEADLCFACSCAYDFKGCRRSEEPPYPCPALGCPQPICCKTESDCPDTGLRCFRPDEPACGVCNPTPGDCSQDQECGPGRICEPIECSCEGMRACTDGCAAAGCAPGETCDPASSRCLPSTCDASHTCPVDFVCSTSACTRARCQSDDECEGFCVQGQCYDDELGVCASPPPSP